MMANFIKLRYVISGLFFFASISHAAISINKTRIIFTDDAKVKSYSVRNYDAKVPYLVQSWISDEKDEKMVNGPLVVLPPIMRISANGKNQLRIEQTPQAESLSKDKETLFYLHILEVPPKNKDSNTVQLAQESRFKLIYRPKKLAENVQSGEFKKSEKIKITPSEGVNKVKFTNLTPYYITMVEIKKNEGSNPINNIDPILLPPKGSSVFGVEEQNIGKNPIISYINDYGLIDKVICINLICE